MIEWFQKGGPIMWPILICSITALSIILERLYNLREHRIIPSAMLNRIETLLRERKIPEATTICKKYPSSMTRILLAAILNHDLEKYEIKEIIEDAGRHEVPAIERYLVWLGIVASIAPMLGLLGTVTGILRVFQVLAFSGSGNPQALAGGISEALITTIVGLGVGIPALAFYHFFSSKADGLVIEMEKTSLKMLNILKRE
ncbi:MAG: MotA/TolQ/ExbB proton channel family protein [Candidatus Tectomicrobia bacterium]|uniref:MotA/TolQ/ExbB proton channel family protein n=1 Tax=Tectimicrobiota bacterium TaxID=2528274 RepID=A0A933GKN8_UNCTE|nr:MotA/TolQ/ExbB proton channel family protein [Candidatus Tectomicrobia bacterium]